MNTLPHILFAIAFLLYAMTGYAQQIVKIKNATGSCVIANISPEQAKETALFEAKINAMKEAGIPERLFAEITQRNEIFILSSGLEIGGWVVEYETVSDDIKVIRQGNTKIMIAEVVINASVIKYDKEKDPSFQLLVEGIRSAYKEKETLSFSITPYQNGYLRIFLFEEDGTGTQIYPDKDLEPNQFLLQDETIKFPINEHYNYVLYKNKKTKDKEVNRIFFLFLKDNVYFTEKNITLESVINWKAKISPDRRTESFHEFIIER